MTERDLAHPASVTAHPASHPPSMTAHPPSMTTERHPSDLAEILERVLDKGIVIAGDIKIDLLDIELLTIRLRLFISSVDTARRAGIDWWETDPALSSRAARDSLAQENAELRTRLHALESRIGSEEPSAVGATEERTPR